MEKKQEDGRFCRAYLRTMDPEQAAAEIGRRDGYAMLGQKGTQQKLERMRCDAAAQLKREDVLRQLARLAFGRVDDAVTLALRRGEAEPEGLELSAVSELRVTEKSVEVKLVDRVRALETRRREDGSLRRRLAGAPSIVGKTGGAAGGNGRLE